MIEFIKNDNELVVNSNKIVFDHNIRFVREVKGTLIVLLEIPSNITYLNNVFGVDKTGVIKWRIQNVSDVFPVKNQLPFENLMVKDDGLNVSDFYGRMFSIDPSNGEILSSDVVR